MCSFSFRTAYYRNKDIAIGRYFVLVDSLSFSVSVSLSYKKMERKVNSKKIIISRPLSRVTIAEKSMAAGGGGRSTVRQPRELQTSRRVIGKAIFVGRAGEFLQTHKEIIIHGHIREAQ